MVWKKLKKLDFFHDVLFLIIGFIYIDRYIFQKFDHLFSIVHKDLLMQVFSKETYMTEIYDEYIHNGSV